MERHERKRAKTKKMLIKSDEGNVIGEHWISENGEKGLYVKNKGFIPYKRLLLLMTA